MELNELKVLLKDPEQLKVVIEALRSNNALSEEVKGFLQLYDNVGGNVESIRNYINETEISFTRSIRRKNNGFRVLKYAAGLVILIVSTYSIYTFFTSPKDNNKNSEVKNMFIDPGIPVFMSKKTDIDWSELMFAIKNQSPEEALTVWQKIEKKACKNDTVLYYGGIVYRNIKSYKKANYFFKANLNSTSAYNQNSIYFLAINAWERGNRSLAKKLFLNLKNASNLDLRRAVILHLNELSE